MNQRLFIAIELPGDLLDALGSLQDQLEPIIPPGTVRWVRPTSIHLTLKFLGDTPGERRPQIERALEAVRIHEPFTLSAQGVGCFPNFKRPRVVWAGLAGQVEPLHALRDTVESLIAPLGYPTEQRPFSPHLTIGRVHKRARKSAVRTMGEQLEGFKAGHLGTLTVSGLSLMQSRLGPGGAIYTQLAHMHLEGAL